MPRVKGKYQFVPPQPENSGDQLCLFENGGLNLAKLRLVRDEFIGTLKAANTEKAYKNSWALFLEWCTRAGHRPLPASPETVGLFATYLIEEGRRLNTVNLYCAAISDKHHHAGLASPIDSHVRAIIRGAKRALKEQPRKKAALTIAQLRRISLAIDDGTKASARNRAILVLGFATGMRRSELSALDLADIYFDGRRGMRVHLRKSKTDQIALGREIGVFPGMRPESCPVKLMRAWIAIRGEEPGPLFPPILRNDVITKGRMIGESINQIIKRAIGTIGLNPAAYGAHSLRASFVTGAHNSGASTMDIMDVTGHKTFEMVRRYVRPDALGAKKVINL
jgi:integrase